MYVLEQKLMKCDLNDHMIERDNLVPFSKVKV